MSSFKEIYVENLARIKEADNLEVWGITEEGESIPVDADGVDYFCVFAHIPGEGIIDLVDVETHDEALEWFDAICANFPHL